jgi:lon-related putative ATP-dependent protease
VRQSIEDLEERYADLPPVHAYLAAVQEDVLAHVAAFKDSQPADGESGGPAEAAARERFFHRYEVNLLIDNSKREGAPVVVETAPTVANLGGRIEKEALFGALFTDVTMIRPGSLHKANGGFLVLPIEDVLREPFAWDTLKRALKNHEVQIEDPGERIGAISARGLRPQAVPLDLKVVLVGSPYLYSMLHAYDDDFAELFKVKADFDNRMALNSEHTRRVLQVLRDFCAREGVPSIDNEGAARILEHALRLAEDQQYLSTQFGALTDLLREASYWVDRTGATQISAEHVRRALAAQRYRAGRMPERLRELIARRLLIIETTGSVIGQINGLAVISTGDNAFGQPTRITVSVGPGREGVVDIEREARLGGPIHSKGVMILGGYLSQTYAPNRPTSLKARLVFEQSYDGVDGDSASSAELYALVSALAEVPLRQGIAVTGAISQRGEIQAIGGVNEKIEGFFDICSALGLTGDQGVLIPQANVEHLMLREDLVEAVAAGRFHIWAARTANEGIALLTGQTAGERDADGNFPPDTVNARVAVRLQQFLDSLHPIDQWRKRQPDD